MSARLFDRRAFVGSGAALLLAPSLAGASPRITRTAAANPFTLGLASGDPQPDGFVIWTRLAPQPLTWDGGGGLAGEIEVRWEVAADAAMRNIVSRGAATADDRFAHAVHIEVQGLQPQRPYWYRFTAMGHESSVGRSRTAPAPGARLDRLRIVVASCAHWELGWFSAYRHMAAENPDLVLFLGDYIYEYSYRGERAVGRTVRQHDRGADAADLPAYRNRYALHRTDPDLQALHACAPCLMTWDDHEVQNDYANRWSQFTSVTEADFLRRRAAAYQAYYEHMPLRSASIPSGPDMRVYDRVGFGDLVDISVLDGRQYRTPQPCQTPASRKGHVAPQTCRELSDASRTMLGAAQERWLYDGFGQGRARWTLVAQDLLVASLLQADRDGQHGHYTDGWDGYEANRDRMLAALDASGARNPVFLGGDIHSFWANDLKSDFANPRSRTVATEFVGTSISQESPPPTAFAGVRDLNPHVRYVDTTTNGYVSLDLGRDHLETRFRAISDRHDPKATVSTLQSFVVEDGRPGVVHA